MEGVIESLQIESDSLIDGNKEKYVNLKSSISRIKTTWAETGVSMIRLPTEGSVFVTITLSPKIYGGTVLSQYYQTYGIISRILEKFCFDYYMMPEVTSAGNVHYHGWAMMRNLRRIPFMINEIKKKRNILGFVKIDKITTGYTKILCYIIKDWSETRQFMRDPFFGIVYSALNINSN